MTVIIVRLSDWVLCRKKCLIVLVAVKMDRSNVFHYSYSNKLQIACLSVAVCSRRYILIKKKEFSVLFFSALLISMKRVLCHLWLLVGAAAQSNKTNATGTVRLIPVGQSCVFPQYFNPVGVTFTHSLWFLGLQKFYCLNFFFSLNHTCTQWCPYVSLFSRVRTNATPLKHTVHTNRPVGLSL